MSRHPKRLLIATEWRRDAAPAGFPAIPATPEAELQAILESLDNKKQAWAALGTAERAALLRETLRTTIAVRPSVGIQRRRAGVEGNNGCMLIVCLQITPPGRS